MVDNDYTLEGRFEIANENMKQEMKDYDCNDQWSGVRCS